MPKGMIILGSAGAGKTTLGKLTAGKLGIGFIDIDEYIWRNNTGIPYTAMYPKDEKIRRLRAAAEEAQEFVMAGSMDSFHEHFDDMFLLAVYLTADERIRIHRIHDREFEEFGNRVLPGGDMYEVHLSFLKDAAGYDRRNASCNCDQHELWLSQLTCPVLRLDGGEELERNAERIVEAYRGLNL